MLATNLKDDNYPPHLIEMETVASKLLQALWITFYASHKPEGRYPPHLIEMETVRYWSKLLCDEGIEDNLLAYR